MFTAKLLDTSDSVLSAIGRSNNEYSHLLRMSYAQFLAQFRSMTAAFCGTDLCAGLGSARPTSLVGIADISQSHLSSAFRCMLLAKFCKAYPLASFRGKSWLVCGAVNIKAALSKGFQLVKPVLFPFNLDARENQLNHFKDERRFTVLVKGILQLGIAMNTVSEIAEMANISVVEVDRTANVEQSGNGTGNAVYPASLGNGIMRLHLLNLLYRLVGVWLGTVPESPTTPHYTISMRFPSSFMGVHHG